MIQFPSSQNLIKLLMRYKYLLLVIAVGVVLILLPTGTGNKTAKQSEGDLYPPYSVTQMEQKLAEAIEKIDGAGEVEVVLTLESDMELFLQEDVTSRSNRELENEKLLGTELDSEHKTVLLDGDSTPIVTKKLYPQFRGALIVCQGANHATVKFEVMNAISALTGLRTDKITVVKMK